MLAALIFSYEGRRIKFTVHEILAIALDIIDELHEEWRLIPASPASFANPSPPMSIPSEWMREAKAIRPGYSRFYKIGGHLIKCNQETGKGLLADYISDCGELP